jgi:hypothetical protein
MIELWTDAELAWVGPDDRVLYSLADFERTYGDRKPVFEVVQWGGAYSLTIEPRGPLWRWVLGWPLRTWRNWRFDRAH